MKFVKKFVAYAAALLMLTATAFAEETTYPTFKATIDGDNISVIETDLASDTDNSNLNVKVIKVTGDSETIIYEGLLGNYENGLWSFTDFSEIDILVIFEWDSMENEAIYIIPRREASSDAALENIKNTYVTDNTIEETVGKESTETDTTTINSTELIEYDITYSIVSDNTLNMDIEYNVYNGNAENKSISLIAALYYNGVLCDLKTQPLYISSQANVSESIVLPLPDNNENYSVKLMVWDGLGTIRPIGNAKSVADLDNYSRVKYLYITSNADVGFNVFMNAATVKGANSDMIHTLQYNSSKITPIDLCGFTFEKELSAGTIENSNVIIQGVDLNAGKIQYRFNLSTGRNTGVTNMVRFKTLSQLQNEQIIYTIQ